MTDAERSHPAPLFEANERARADLRPGTLNALTGEDEWIYYGQVKANPHKTIAIFQRRDRIVVRPNDVLGCPIMSELTVNWRSIGDAVRSGMWKKLGRHPLSEEVSRERANVIWPVLDTLAEVWVDSEKLFDTRIEDPAIQDLEVAIAYDAEFIGERLTADFDPQLAKWWVGGPVWRERKSREEWDRRSPTPAFLPADYVPIGAAR